MNMRILTGTVVIALACVVILVAIHPPEPNNNLPNQRDFTNREVIVYSDDNFTEKIKDLLVDSTKSAISFQSKAPSDNDIVIIDGQWLSSGGEKVLSTDQIKSMIGANIPVIFVNDDSYLYQQLGLEFQAEASAENSMAYSVYLDSGGITHLYVYSGDDLGDALNTTYEWADDISSPASGTE